MEWIKVTDRMPSKNDEYLCVFIGWDDMEFQRVLDYELYGNQDIWSDQNGNTYQPTHWMHLPELPNDPQT